MDSVQLQFERAVGDELIAWLNARDGSLLQFHARGGEAPDLIYRDGARELGLEIVASYYDQADAAMKWKGARNAPDAPKHWSGWNFDASLIAHLQEQIEKKCKKAYGAGCALLVSVRPPLTDRDNMDRLLKSLNLPASVPFSAIFVAGEFPTSPTCRGGYYAWQVWPKPDQS